MDKAENRVWRAVGGEWVADLLQEIRVHHGSRKARGDYLARYIRSQITVGDLVTWTVVLISNPRGELIRLGGWRVRPVHRRTHLPDSQDSTDVYRIRRLVSPTDEMIDLTDDQRDQAMAETLRQYHDDPAASRHSREPTRPSGPHIRRVRDPKNGFLLLYPLQQRDSEGVPFVGFAVSFPEAENETPITYVVNSVYLQEEFDG